jgi:4-amino-4-deoxy-L-arabinose transferase-like glycosyltransferase
VFGFSVLAVLVVQSMLDTLTCFIVFSLGTKAAGSRSAGVLAAFFYAVYPAFILSAGTVLTETLTFLLLTCGLYLYWVAIKGSTRLAAAAGLLMGVVILLKPAMLLFPFFVLIGFWLNRRADRGWLAKGLVYVVVCCAVISPWTLRNYLAMGRFIPVASHGGNTLWGGTGPADGRCMSHAHMPVYVPGEMAASGPEAVPVSRATYDKIAEFRSRLSRLDEAGQDALYRQAALQEISEHPGRYAFLGVKKFFRLWLNLWYDAPPSKKSLALAALNLTLMILALLGALAKLVDRRFAQMVLILAVYTTAISMLTFSMVRYSYPVFPFILILVAAFLALEPAKRAATQTLDRT